MQGQLGFGLVTLAEVVLAEANELLEAWGHYLGPCKRPFGSMSHVLFVAGEPVSVAVSASIVNGPVAGYERKQVVELARLCSSQKWATRPMLRLWREVAAPTWPYWKAEAAVAYSQNTRHEGNIYRWDGWERGRTDSGSSGGGTWSKKRQEGEAVKGRKTLWVWRYGEAA